MIDVQQSVQLPDVRANRSSRVRTVLVASLSAFVVLAGLFYVLAPTDASVQLTAQEVDGPQPYDYTVLPEYSLAAAMTDTVKKRTSTETIYGRIDHPGVPISHVVLRITAAERATKGQAATIKLSGKGVYRAVVHLKPGKYRLTLSLTVHKRTRSATLVRRLLDRRFYFVRGLVRPSGIVTFLPVTAY